MTVLIQGGTVVNADRSFRADVLCQGGKITAVADRIDTPPADATVVDAAFAIRMDTDDYLKALQKNARNQ